MWRNSSAKAILDTRRTTKAEFFHQVIESSTEAGGQPAFDPQLLISLWIYAYSQGISSAAEPSSLARR
jgi:transposase